MCMEKGTAFYVPNGPNLLADFGSMGLRSLSNENELKAIGKTLESEIEVAVVISPHFATRGGIGVVGKEKLDQIFDFYGFPPEFYEYRYEAPGSEKIAESIVRAGKNGGLDINITEKWGLDHGAWTPLIYMLPSASTPIIPISVDSHGKPEDYMILGKAIKEISDEHNLTLISTGSIIHRLDLLQRGITDTPKEAEDYLSLLISALDDGNWDSVWNIPENLFRGAMPEGGELSLRAIAGFIGEGFRAEVLANQIVGGSISMSSIKFAAVP